MTIKQSLFRLIDDDNEQNSIWNGRISSLIMFLIIVSIIAVILESDSAISERHSNLFFWFECIAVAVFTLEYIIRFFTAHLAYPDLSVWKARLKFVTSPMAIIDFLAILPFYIEQSLIILPILFPSIHTSLHMLDLRFIRVLRLMRLLRIFKLNRYNSSMKLIGDVMREEKEKLFITIFMTGILLVLSSAIVFTVEHEAQPENFPNIYSSMWWAIATLTTVGYGDVYPVTALGKMLAGVIALLGIGLVALPTGILSGSFVQAINEEKEAKRFKMQEELFDDEKSCEACPHCGQNLPAGHQHSEEV